ncbi:MAG: tRNA (N(6)-L-threonylcarbamoyladenosine(37)-C(2))-methylthiotransferase MtaB [Lachnospiraceae bacterium]|nr:tRNA (N(6)-L-threonylcarbamoyladenosine(37)-C(2))-methylthiotransferase MtaB [Lachnospiraceae bacterium]
MIKAGLLSLGCKVNSCETEQIREELVSYGIEIVDFEEYADVYVINTCSVTNIADRKSRQMLHKAKKMNPEALVVATGCYAQIAGEKLADTGDADIVIGNNHKGNVAEYIANYFKIIESSDIPDVYVDKIADEKCFEEINLSTYPEKSRAFVKIEDGCNQFCSYCIIPYARGRVRSRDEESIISEVKKLSENGFKEIVLTGIHLSSYGNMNYEKALNKDNPLLKLINILSEIDGIERIRLGSLEPRIITEEFAKALAANSKVCPHFHLSLQSGCDSVLKRMNRHYTAEEFLDKCQILRAAFDRPAITTDVIVGFPGESEEEFIASKEMLEKASFSKMHIFKYSRRAGTVADRMPNQIIEKVKHERSVILQELDDKMHYEYIKSFVGETENVLIEEDTDEFFSGLTGRYINVKINKKSDSKAEINTIRNVKITGISENNELLADFC